MALRKLTPAEIKSTVQKIRMKYDEYHYKYFKSTKFKQQFEERYINALKTGVDISAFLLAEIEAIEELLKREEEKVLAKDPPTVKELPQKSFADKIIEENRQKILKYPEINFHPDASEEIRRLYGALNKLQQEYWPSLYNVLRNTVYSLNTRIMMNMETQLNTLGGTGKDGVSARLDRYIARLNRFPRDYKAIDKEEKDYLLEVAFFLHSLVETLTEAQVKYHASLGEEEKIRLAEVINYVTDLLVDFRLKDLKRK